jgi:hypothetical protein
MKLKLIIFTLLFLFCFISVQSQTKPTGTPRKIRVGVLITAENDRLKSLVYSYLDRELRDLKDVEVTSVNSPKDYDYAISAIVTTNYEGRGFILSIVFIESEIHIPPFQKKPDGSLDMYYKSVFVDHQLVTSGNEANLKQECAGLVAELDTKYLQTTRLVLKIMATPK